MENQTSKMNQIKFYPPEVIIETDDSGEQIDRIIRKWRSKGYDIRNVEAHGGGFTFIFRRRYESYYN